MTSIYPLEFRVNRPDAVLLDFGGVLTTDLWESMRAATRRAGLPQDTIIDLMYKDPEGHARFAALERGEMTQAQYEPYLASRAGISAEGLLASLCADLRPDEEMWETVTRLREQGVPTAVLSNSWGAGYLSLYDDWDLESRFDAVVVSHELGMRKPEPRIFLHALSVLGAPADRTVFVDDIASNLAPARAMGMEVIHHTDSRRTVTELQGRFSDVFA